jgi:EAL domain-containing protein (putative c-di-GMP-specific phosphodiesterase class I)
VVSEALKEDRIEAFYQPIIKLDTEQIVGLEALCRVVTRSGRVLPAQDFQEATSDVLVASELTQRMVAQVAQDVCAWREMGISPKQIGINVTASDFRGGKLASHLVSAFERAGMPLADVGVEITESVYLDNHDPAISHEICALREAGIYVALDDFGTGYASLTHLLTVPVDMIKIDKSFIDKMEAGNASFAIVKGLITIANDLNISIVAEGVETPTQAAQLRDIRCPLAQGFHFARPANRHEITHLLLQRAQSSSREELQAPYPSRR